MYVRSVVTLSLLLAVARPAQPQGILTTVAGTEWIFAADGVRALEAPLSPIIHVTVDNDGRPIFADPGNAVVHRINRDGTLTVLAGNGIIGFSGEGGPATAAALNTPQAAVYDSKGNLYISDLGNNRIRRVTPAGIISTIAGSATIGFSGDGGPASRALLNAPGALAIDADDNVYFIDRGNSRVRRINTQGVITTVAGNGSTGATGDGGPATAASFNSAEALAFDRTGNLYLADSGNHRIRRIGRDGMISTIAGTGREGSSPDGAAALGGAINFPTGLAFDAAGLLHFSDTQNGRIRQITANGTLRTVAGTGQLGFTGDNGPATAARLNGSFGLAFDRQGNLLIADRDNFRLRTISPAGVIATLAGNARFRFNPPNTPALQSFLLQPQGVASGPRNSYLIADSLNNYLHSVSADGTLTTLAGTGVRQSAGNNVPAVSSPLANPIGVATDAQGNLYIAETDSNVVRRLSPIGTLTTVAGNGTAGFSGDGGPATSAALRMPFAVAVDPTGVLYIADAGNHRIRQVSPGGIITTIAGDGLPRYGGDNGPATRASLAMPVNVVLDRAGNLLVADTGNGRIRRITPAGTISTVAGGGTRGGLAADGFPATEAELRNPYGIALDSTGNIYFSDATQHRVRRISPTGALSTVAGNGQAGFAGDGGLSTRAVLSSPAGLTVDAAGSLLIADMNNNRIRAVLNRPVTLQAAPSALNFSARSDGPVTAPELLNVTSSLRGLAFTVTGSAPWLRPSVNAAVAPAVISITTNPAGLAPGTYNASLALTAATSGASALLPVSFTVAPADPPRLALDRTNVTFATSSSAELAEILVVQNVGGGATTATLAVRTESGGNWLALADEVLRVGALEPASTRLVARPGNLPPGTYKATLSLSAPGAERVTVPVVLTITRPLPSIRLSQTALKFTAVATTASSGPQDVLVFNSGAGSLTWEAFATTLSGGAAWLKLEDARGTIAGTTADGDAASSRLRVSVDGANLRPGDYFARIDVRSAGASNSPQTIAVLLTVLPAGTNPGPQLQPSSLIFIGTAGDSPSSQSFQVSNLTGTPMAFALSTAYSGVAGWLQVAPANSVVVAGRPISVVVQPDFRALPAGVHEASLNLAFEDGSVRRIAVTAIVSEPAADESKDGERQLTNSCVPSSLVLTVASPSAVFDAVLNQPVSIDVRLANNCGALATTAGSVVALPEGESQINLSHVGGGRYTGVWQPRNVSTTPRTLFLRGYWEIANRNLLTGDARPQPVISRVAPSVSATFVSPGAIVNGASFEARLPVAPGALISVFGSQLADAEDVGTAPLPTSLAGTEVTLGDQSLPLLYSSSGQLNAMVPFNLPLNTQLPLHVRRGDTLSYGDSLTIAPAQPAVFTRNQQGTGQGAIVDGVTNILADATNPARPGRIVTIYCTGLGQTNPAVAAGEAAPLTVLSRTVLPVAVQIGGVDATVTFAGLAPGFAGLYQVNAEVPATLPTNPETPLTITIAGQVSPPVTLAVAQ